MKKNAETFDPVSRERVRRQMRLVPGGRDGVETDPPTAEHPMDERVRDLLVQRARQRLANGYYGRPEVVERLVELLWDEFHTR